MKLLIYQNLYHLQTNNYFFEKIAKDNIKFDDFLNNERFIMYEYDRANRHVRRIIQDFATIEKDMREIIIHHTTFDLLNAFYNLCPRQYSDGRERLLCTLHYAKSVLPNTKTTHTLKEKITKVCRGDYLLAYKIFLNNYSQYHGRGYWAKDGIANSLTIIGQVYFYPDLWVMKKPDGWWI